MKGGLFWIGFRASLDRLLLGQMFRLAPQTILHHKKFSTTIFSSKILSCTVCVLLKGMPEVSVSMCVCSVDCGNGKTNLVLLFVLANLLNIYVYTCIIMQM